ncbi:MAG: hypothetical protein ACREIS_13145, partial [Nitrospiraceae bacterium]
MKVEQEERRRERATVQPASQADTHEAAAPVTETMGKKIGSLDDWYLVATGHDDLAKGCHVRGILGDASPPSPSPPRSLRSDGTWKSSKANEPSTERAHNV